MGGLTALPYLLLGGYMKRSRNLYNKRIEKLTDENKKLNKEISYLNKTICEKDKIISHKDKTISVLKESNLNLRDELTKLILDYKKNRKEYCQIMKEIYSTKRTYQKEIENQISLMKRK